jgi:hypothetical protein
MNKVVVAFLALTSVGSLSWAVYERDQKQKAIGLVEASEARLKEAELMAREQRDIAEVTRRQLEVAMAKTEAARMKMEACCNKRK